MKNLDFNLPHIKITRKSDQIKSHLPTLNRQIYSMQELQNKDKFLTQNNDDNDLNIEKNTFDLPQIKNKIKDINKSDSITDTIIQSSSPRKVVQNDIRQPIKHKYLGKQPEPPVQQINQDKYIKTNPNIDRIRKVESPILQNFKKSEIKYKNILKRMKSANDIEFNYKNEQNEELETSLTPRQSQQEYETEQNEGVDFELQDLIKRSITEFAKSSRITNLHSESKLKHYQQENKINEVNDKIMFTKFTRGSRMQNHKTKTKLGRSERKQ